MVERAEVRRERTQWRALHWNGDRYLMALILALGDSPLADSQAKMAAEMLTQAYPNHSWHVEVKQGVIIIKHADASGARGTIGMLRKLSTIGHDARVFKYEIIRAAGELLERAGLPRSGYNGDLIRKMELDKHLQKHWKAPVVPSKIIH